MIQLKDVCKYYQVGDDRVRALDHANLHIYPQEFVSIIGPSGSGKSTLMNIIWFFIGGIWIFLSHIFWGVLFCITIIGIPFGMQHFKLAGLALTPFGHDVK